MPPIVGLTANVIFDREVEDTAVAAMAFASGPCATVTVTHAAIEPRNTLRVFGTTGLIDVSVLNAGDLVINRQGQQVREMHPPAPNLHQPLVEDFVEAVQSGRGPRVDGEVGRAVAEIEAQIYNRG